MEDSDDNIFSGAIFMSNRTTKQECFRRKLFGLPSAQSNFVKKVKAGMILFLFEHEERMLYGVYEATSDGALNIVPDAYSSSGLHFPAQILFKVVWYCKPLSEKEFSIAIEDNYYQPHKFNFELSYKQVVHLLELFSSKKIGAQNYHSPGSTSRFRVDRNRKNSSPFKSRLNGNDSHSRYDRREDSTSHNIDSRYPDSSGFNVDYSMYHDNERVFNDRKTNQPLEPSSTLMHSSYQSDRSFREKASSSTSLRVKLPVSPPLRENFLASPTHRGNSLATPPPLRGNCASPSSYGHRYFNSDHHSLGSKQLPIALGSDNPSLAPELTAPPRYYVGNHAAAFGSLYYPSHPPSYTNLDGLRRIDASSIPPYAPFDPRLQGSFIPPYAPSDPRLSLTDMRPHSNFLDPKDRPYPECKDSFTPQIYPSTQGMLHAPKEADQLPSKTRLNYCYDMPEASRSQDSSIPEASRVSRLQDSSMPEASRLQESSKGERYWHQEPSADYIPLSNDQNSSDTRSFEQSQYEGEYERTRDDNSKRTLEHNPTPENAEDHLTSQNASLYSDTNRRTSVFSRLSMAPKTLQLDDRARAPHMARAPNNRSPPALDQIVQLLGQRRIQWNKVTRFPKRFGNKGDAQLEAVPKMEQDGADSISEIEQDNEPMAEESFEPPSFNFKRRSDAQKIDCGGAETGHKGEQKRRKLVRPSFSDEDSLVKAIERAQAYIQDLKSKKNVEMSDALARCDDEARNSNGSSVNNIVYEEEVHQKPSVSQTSAIHVESRTVDSLQNSESTALNDDHLQGSGEAKLSEISKEDMIVAESEGEKCEGINEKEVKCSATAGGDVEVEMLVGIPHSLAEENSALVVHDSSLKGKDSDGSVEKNATTTEYDESIEKDSVELDLSQSASKEDSIMSVDIKPESEQVDDESGGRNSEQKNDEIASNAEPKKVDENCEKMVTVVYDDNREKNSNDGREGNNNLDQIDEKESVVPDGNEETLSREISVEREEKFLDLNLPVPDIVDE